MKPGASLDTKSRSLYLLTTFAFCGVQEQSHSAGTAKELLSIRVVKFPSIGGSLPDLLPLFLIVPVVFVVLVAVSVQAKRREGEDSKALSSEARGE
jgi:hypothetical protein